MRLQQARSGNEERVAPMVASCEGMAWVRIEGAFFPDLIEARTGERLRLVFRREEISPCSERIVFSSLGKSVMLPPFEDVSVYLGPLPPGEHPFTCELGVLRGAIAARDPQPGALVKTRFRNEGIHKCRSATLAPTLRRIQKGLRK